MRKYNKRRNFIKSKGRMEWSHAAIPTFLTILKKRKRLKFALHNV